MRMYMCMSISMLYFNCFLMTDQKVIWGEDKLTNVNILIQCRYRNNQKMNVWWNKKTEALKICFACPLASLSCSPMCGTLNYSAGHSWKTCYHLQLFTFRRLHQQGSIHSVLLLQMLFTRTSLHDGQQNKFYSMYEKKLKSECLLVILDPRI